MLVVFKLKKIQKNPKNSQYLVDLNNTFLSMPQVINNLYCACFSLMTLLK